MPPSLRHLRLAASLLDVGSLTRAATLLGITQPTASRILRELEDHLQLALVERSAQGVELTASGREFARRAADVLAEVDDLLSPGVEAGPGPVVSFAWDGLEKAVGEASRAWNAQHPHRPCRMRQGESPAEDVVNRRADLALQRGAPTRSGLDSCRLYEEDRMAALPLDSPLAERTTLTLADLAPLEFVANATSGTTQDMAWPASSRPQVCTEVAGFAEWMTTIAAARGRFGLTPRSTAQHHPHPQVRFVPVVDAPAVTTRLFWRSGETRSDVRRFVDLVKSHA